MDITNLQLLELGTVGILFYVFIRGFFSYIEKRNSKGKNSINQQLLDAITEQNENHLQAMQESLDQMCKDINSGNDRIVDAITTMHTDLASKLGEIKGKLS